MAHEPEHNFGRLKFHLYLTGSCICYQVWAGAAAFGISFFKLNLDFQDRRLLSLVTSDSVLSSQLTVWNILQIVVVATAIVVVIIITITTLWWADQTMRDQTTHSSCAFYLLRILCDGWQSVHLNKNLTLQWGVMEIEVFFRWTGHTSSDFQWDVAYNIIPYQVK